MQTEPEEWAVELVHDLGVPFGSRNHAALTIQRAFEERERKLRERLEDALLFVPDDYTFGPRQALKETPDAD